MATSFHYLVLLTGLWAGVVAPTEVTETLWPATAAGTDGCVQFDARSAGLPSSVATAWLGDTAVPLGRSVASVVVSLGACWWYAVPSGKCRLHLWSNSVEIEQWQDWCSSMFAACRDTRPARTLATSRPWPSAVFQYDEGANNSVALDLDVAGTANEDSGTYRLCFEPSTVAVRSRPLDLGRVVPSGRPLLDGYNDTGLARARVTLYSATGIFPVLSGADYKCAWRSPGLGSDAELTVAAVDPLTGTASCPQPRSASSTDGVATTLLVNLLVERQVSGLREETNSSA